jgi:hypothetical protein
MSQITSFGSSGTTPVILTLRYTLVNTTPYVVQAQDEFLGVDSTGSAITVQFPNAPVIGRVYIVKDIAGTAYTHNITLTSVGGVVNFDGLTSYIMNTAFESVQLLFNGTEYLLF